MAGSRNAFANLASGQARPAGVLTEQDHNARSPKRTRLSEDAVAAIHTQCVDAETSLEVDHMMLDYLAQQTIRACFASRNPNGQHNPHIALSSNVAMSDAFLAVFRARHPTYKPDAELRFRILLLKLTTLFTQRLTSNPTTPPHDTLVKLRNVNRERSNQWTRASKRKAPSLLHTQLSSSAEQVAVADLERNRAHVLHELGIPPEDEQYEDAFYGTTSSVSLLDILPLFMQVSAARNAISSSNLTQRWMHLACEFMLQACLERYLIFGTSRVEDEAFAWGYLDQPIDAGDDEAGLGLDESNLEINTMFEDEEYAREVEGWNDMKTSHMKDLLSPQKADDPNRDALDPIPHLERLAANRPIAAFEASLLEFLEAISRSIPEPVLVQLEKGKLDGMTEEETKRFLDECGIAVASFFETPVGFKATVE